MRYVSQILRNKPSADVAAIAPDRSVYEMLELLARRNIGAVVVMEGAQLVGIVSERDYARSIALLGRSSKDTLVREIMTERVLVISPTHQVGQCLALMTDKRVRHLPVVENNTVIGLISIGDVVKDIIAEQEHRIADLEAYIAPGR